METLRIKLRIVALLMSVLLLFQNCKAYQSNTTATNPEVLTEKSKKQNKRTSLIVPISIGVVIIGVVILITKKSVKPTVSL